VFATRGGPSRARGRAGECPYPGLASFGREQARWFFGRDELTAELVARLDTWLRGGGVQVVVAPSGAGKSSLLHAGLLSRLADGALPGSSRWPTLVFTPTAQPLAALAGEIAVLTGADPAHPAAEPQRWVEVLRGHIGPEGSGARVLVVVDQFEELFTLGTDDQDRRTFIELLVQLAGPPQPVGLVLAYPGHRQRRPNGAVVERGRPGTPHTAGHTSDRPHRLGPRSRFQP